MMVVKSIDELLKLEPENRFELTIGNFDGVHRGHREFLATIHRNCQASKSKFLVITFIPHPVQILRAAQSFLINTYSERRELLSQCGVDYLLEIDFTRDFSTLTPQDFFERFVFQLSKVDKVYLGHDFVFGANKSGDHQMAKSLCEKAQLPLVLQGEYKVGSDNISSTKVREHIQNGDMLRASDLLGRDYFLSGRVIKGQGRGKQIGFPTANLGYANDLIVPARGVYITQTKFKDLTYNSVTNIGFNPTFNSGRDINIETHLLDFNLDIYGEEMRVCFLQKLRDEKKFNSVNDLIAQIEADIRLARESFNHD